MTHIPALAPTANSSFRPWRERLFQVGAGLFILAIILIWIGTSLASLLALASAVVLAVWAARRPETGTKRRGAFTLTCAILSLPACGIAYLFDQFIQSGDLYQSGELSNLVYTLVLLSTALFVFGVSTLITGIIKRINA